MMDVERRSEQVNASSILTALLNEFSAITDHRTLRDSLPRRLARLLGCRCVLFYQRLGETLQFASGSYDDKPGWSAALLAVAHINPISVNSDVPEACAWREQRVVVAPERCPTLAAAPLIYRRRGIGVLAAVRAQDEERVQCADYWTEEEVLILEAAAGIVAMLLENARLLARDRERIHELSLLNSISGEVNYALYDQERMRSLLIQRTKEIAAIDRCALIDPAAPDPASWVTPALRVLLLQRFSKQRAPVPLVIERIGEAGMPQIDDYLKQLPPEVKTFFAIPLLSGRRAGRRCSGLQEDAGAMQEGAQDRRVLGIIACAYHRSRKVRREELVLLQVLASQSGVALENMRLIEEKRRLDRLAALGEMAANVAHEVRNPLASIKTSMQMLMDELRDEGAAQRVTDMEGEEQSAWVQESIGVVLKEVERLDAIVRDLLLFARPRQLHRTPCSPVELCERVLQLIQTQCLEANVSIQRIYEEVPLLHVDAAQIEQVLLNLYMNALQAMPDGGTLTIACRALSTEDAPGDGVENETVVSSSAARGANHAVLTGEEARLSAQEWVEIAVSDTGSGIPPDRLERIFQPFFTTKAHGIGLGLAITRRLVEDHGGYIHVEGHASAGARIAVHLPLRYSESV